MASPQVENGHIDIANEIAEALAGSRISGEECQVLWVILRKTYGWHKKEDAIALSQFCLLTKMSKPSINRALKKLLTKKLIIIDKNVKAYQPNSYGFNKHYDEWELLTKKITTPKTIDKKVNPTIDKNVTHKRKGTTKEKYNSMDVFNYWNSKKIISHRELTTAIRGKINAKLQSYSIEEIKHAIDNYANVIGHPETYWLTQKWLLVEFLDRGFEKCLDDVVCEQVYVNKKGSKPVIPEAKPFEPYVPVHLQHEKYFAEIWPKALEKLKENMIGPNFDAWLKDTVGIGIDDGKFIIQAPSKSVAEHLSTQFDGVIKRHLAPLVGRVPEIRFTWRNDG